MKNRRVIVLLVVITLVGAFAIWRGIASYQRRTIIAPPGVSKEDVVQAEIKGLPGGKFLTEEDVEELAKVVADNPLSTGLEALTEDEAAFLVESEVIDEKDVELLLRLEKIIGREWNN